MKRGIFDNNNISVCLVSLTFLFLISFAISSHVVTTSSGGGSFSIDEDSSTLLNFSINHTGIGNLTNVNITIPQSFTYIDNTNATDLSIVPFFSNTTVLLSWTNDSIGLAENLTENFIWFNVTALTPGEYNITVLTYNGVGSDETNITITVNDTTSPSIEYNSSQTPSNNSNLSLPYIIVNVSASDTIGVENITINLYNSSFELVSSNISVGPSSYTNFSSLSEGTYYINATANDSASNENSTQTITVTLDTTSPTILLLTPSNATSSTTSTYNFTFNVTDSNDIANCSLILDESSVASSTTIINGTNGISHSSIGVGLHNWTINCTDYSGNRATNSSYRDLTVTSSSSSSTSTSSGSSGFHFLSEKSLLKGYNKVMYKNWVVRFKHENSYHTVRMKSIDEESVDLTIASDPLNVTMKINEEKKFDLDGDSYYDLYIKVNSIGAYNANLTFSSINEPITLIDDSQGETEDTSLDVKEETKESASNLPSDLSNSSQKTYSFLYLIIIIVVIVAGYFLIKNKKRNRPNKASKKKKTKK